MAFTHQKTVTVTPANDAYGWEVIDNATNQAANWVTVTQQGTSDVWDFLVADNAGSTQRVATATVTHSNGVTSDSFTITQVGVSSTPGPSTPSPSSNLWNIVTGAATNVFSTGFTMNGGPFTYAGTPGADNNTARGFEWGTDQNNLSNTHVQNTVGTMAYSHGLTGLNASTTYYYRAYSTSPAEGTVYGSIESVQTSAPQLSFNALVMEVGSTTGTPGSTVDETPFAQRVFFTINATQEIDGHTIDVLSLTKTAPNAGAGEIEDFSLSNSNMLNGSTMNDLAPFEFGGAGTASNAQAKLYLAIADDNLTEGTETYQVTISPDYKDANGNVAGQHGLATTYSFNINDTSVNVPVQAAYGQPANHGILGSGVTSTSGSVTLYTYTFDNNPAVVGPSHTILFSPESTPTHTINTSATNVANTIYWSNNADGSTNDTTAITAGANAVLQNFSVSGNNANNTGSGGSFYGSWQVTFEDKATASAPESLSPPQS